MREPVTDEGRTRPRGVLAGKLSSTRLRSKRILFVALALAVAACEPEGVEDVAPPELPPEAAMAVVEEPGEVTLEQMYPITAEDVGDLVLASGIVVGNPGPEGFFLATEGGQVVFVRSSQPAMPGQAVRAAGPVQGTEVSTFEGWRRDLLGETATERELIAPYYIAATRVTSIAGP